MFGFSITSIGRWCYCRSICFNCDVSMANYHLPSGKLTWRWNITIFSSKYIFKQSTFHCQIHHPNFHSVLLSSLECLNLQHYRIDLLWLKWPTAVQCCKTAMYFVFINSFSHSVFSCVYRFFFTQRYHSFHQLDHFLSLVDFKYVYIYIYIYIRYLSVYPLKKLTWQWKIHHFFLADTSSNGCVSIVMLLFRGGHFRVHVLCGWIWV